MAPLAGCILAGGDKRIDSAKEFLRFLESESCCSNFPGLADLGDRGGSAFILSTLLSIIAA